MIHPHFSIDLSLSLVISLLSSLWGRFDPFWFMDAYIWQFGIYGGSVRKGRCQYRLVSKELCLRRSAAFFYQACKYEMLHSCWDKTYSSLRIANVICIVNIVINALIHTVMRLAPDVSHGDNFLFVEWGVVEYLLNSPW